MPTRLPRERERKIQASIRVRLWRLHGIRLYRRNVALVRTQDKRTFSVEAPGRADLYGWHVKTGRHFEIETKATGKRPTTKQLLWLMECNRTGAAAWWTDNANDAERVAEAVLAGGLIVWDDDGEFHVEVP